MMRLTTDEKVNAGFAVALGVVAILGIASLTTLQRFASTSQEVSRTHRALTELEGVLANLTAAESAQRGYVITGDPLYLQQYEPLGSSALTQIRRLREETFMDPEQQATIAKLGDLTARRLVIMNEVAVARRDSSPETAALRVASGRGRAVMDSIRPLARRVAEVEQTRLDQRVLASERRGRIVVAVIGIAGVVVFLVIFGSAMAVRRDYAERRRAEQMLRESETLLSQFMENLPMGVVVIDTRWQPRFANNAAVDILGPQILIDTGERPLPLMRAGEHSPYPDQQSPLTRALGWCDVDSR